MPQVEILLLPPLLALAACCPLNCGGTAWSCEERDELEPARRADIEATALDMVQRMLAGDAESTYAMLGPDLQAQLDEAAWVAFAQRLPKPREPEVDDLRLLERQGMGGGPVRCGPPDDTEGFLRFRGRTPSHVPVALVTLRLPDPGLSHRIVLELWEGEGGWKVVRFDVLPVAFQGNDAATYRRLSDEDVEHHALVAQKIHLDVALLFSRLSPRVGSGMETSVGERISSLSESADQYRQQMFRWTTRRRDVETTFEIDGVRLQVSGDGIAPVVAYVTHGELGEETVSADADALLAYVRAHHPRLLEGFDRIGFEASTTRRIDPDREYTLFGVVRHLTEQQEPVALDPAQVTSQPSP